MKQPGNRGLTPDDRPPLITSFFAVSGDDFAPDTFTRLVGISPTDAQPRRVAGYHADGTSNVAPATWWFKISKQPSFSTDEGLRALLDILWERRSVIRSTVKDGGLNAQFGTNVTIVHLPPEYSIEASTFERLAYFRCPWLLDIFFSSTALDTIDTGASELGLGG